MMKRGFENEVTLPMVWVTGLDVIARLRWNDDYDCYYFLSFEQYYDRDEKPCGVDISEVWDATQDDLNKLKLCTLAYRDLDAVNHVIQMWEGDGYGRCFEYDDLFGTINACY